MDCLNPIYQQDGSCAITYILGTVVYNWPVFLVTSNKYVIFQVYVYSYFIHSQANTCRTCVRFLEVQVYLITDSSWLSITRESHASRVAMSNNIAHVLIYYLANTSVPWPCMSQHMLLLLYFCNAFSLHLVDFEIQINYFIR